ncbi:MAG TPA: DUF1616 domain-containing protein [Methanomassiliicoccales archaeon]|nr:DUF1616 domain-containing protein [Methanomassiliicoccales archaeon]
MSHRAAKWWDLFAAVLLSGLLIIIVLALPVSPLRTVLALPYLFFAPGYVLTTFFFPERAKLDSIERIALSLALSLVITSFIGFALNYTPFGIRLESIIASLSIFIVVFSALSYMGRNKADAPFVPFDSLNRRDLAARVFGKQGNVDRFLTILLVLAVVSSIVAMAYVIAVPQQGSGFTEFYVLGPDGKAIDYPHNLSFGQNAKVILGITNHENHPVTYYVQVWLVNASFIDNKTSISHMFFIDQMSVTLNATSASLDGPSAAQYRTSYTFSVNQTGNFKLWFFLYKDSVPPYAQDLVRMNDYAGGATDELLYYAVSNDTSVLYGLNLNLVVTSS